MIRTDRLKLRPVPDADRVQNTVEIAGEWCDSAYWRLDRPGGPSPQSAPSPGPSAAA